LVDDIGDIIKSNENVLNDAEDVDFNELKTRLQDTGKDVYFFLS
jgi:hypothetical protein